MAESAMERAKYAEAAERAAEYAAEAAERAAG